MTTGLENRKHHKHAKLSRAKVGEWARNELAIVGAPCGIIRKLAEMIITELQNKWPIAFADAAHHTTDNRQALPRYLDMGHSRRLTLTKNPGSFEHRAMFNDQSLVLVNGNHFTAQAQVIIIDAENPLTKDLGKLTNVVLLLMKNGEAQIPEEVKASVANIERLPLLSLDDIQGIVSFIDAYLMQRSPPIHGLVLAGGKSVRMGIDKGLLQYHGSAQREYIYQILQAHCGEVYLSCNHDQRAEVPEAFNVIEDQFLGLGPMGGILSAMQSNPDAAWLAVACDLPFLNEATLNYLIERRNAAKFATALMNDAQGFPEPMITIWEPRSYPLLLQYLSMGLSCPRKMLINADIELLPLPDQLVLENINEPAAYHEAFSKLNHE